MYVDVVTSSLSLNVLPEDYRFILYMQEADAPYAPTVSNVVASLLTSAVHPTGGLVMSLYDFLTLRKKLKQLNLIAQLYLSQKAFTVVKNHWETVKLVGDIKAGQWNSRVPDGLLKTTLHEDQKAAVAYHLVFGRSGNWFAVGLGKTLIALYWYGVLLRQGKIKRLIVFCLNENKVTWEREIAKHTSWADYVTVVGNGTTQVIRDVDSFLEKRHHILVVHYDALAGPPRRGEDMTRFNPRQSQVMEHLLALRPDAVVCDEGHILAHVTAKRTMCISTLFTDVAPANAMFLTATPVSESPVNAYSILRMIRPQVLPSNSRFEDHFCNMVLMDVKRKDKRTGKKVKTGRKIKILDKRKPYKNLDELAELMQIYGFRRTHADVQGMPPTVDQVVYLALTGPQEALYRRIAAETYEEIAALPEKALNLDLVIVRTLRLRQALSSPALLQETGESCKYLALENIVEQHMSDPSNKLIIWSAFKESCNVIAGRLKGYDAVTFHGDVPADEFRQRERDFMDADSPRILVATPDKAGIGKNLQRARMDVWVDKPLRRLLYTQGRGRIERRDAVGTSVHVTLRVKDTIDDWVEDLLARKAAVTAQLLDEGRTDVEDVRIDKKGLLAYIRGAVPCESASK